MSLTVGEGRGVIYGYIYFYLFINVLQHNCTSAEGLYDSWSYSLLKDVVFEKLKKEKKFHDWTWAALNLQPSDLHSNT